MLSLIARIFGKERKQEEALQRIPAIGEVWGFKSGPWPPTHTVLIVDVRDGWVRYTYQRIGGGDKRQKIEQFLWCYYPMTDANETI